MVARSALLILFAAVAARAIGLHEYKSRLDTSLLEPSPTPSSSTEVIRTYEALATDLFNDTDMPCTYLCDYRSIHEKIPRPLTDAEQMYIKLKPIYTSVTSVAASCPAIYAGNKDHSSFDLSTLTLHPGTHLIMYGHSYMWESFHTIRAAHKLLGQITKEGADVCKLNNECTGANGCVDCTGAGGAICAGGSEPKGEPYCGGTSNFNCDCNKAYRLYFSNGATLTGVFNWGWMQQEKYADRLSAMLQQGVDGAAYTHALVMEPHLDAFFTNGAGDTMDATTTYGCGWSSKFWSLWQTDLPTTAKLYHVPAWGYSDENLQIYSSGPPVLKFNTENSNCTAESQWTDGETKASNFKSGGIQGHHCIAVRDSSGYSLGIVPRMAARLLAQMYS